MLGHQPRQLSNGQKQRTALARALVGEPKVLLLDDPLRNVDAKLRYEMRLELPRLLRRAGAATIYVSQDYREAMALGDRIAVLVDGRIVQDAPPEDDLRRARDGVRRPAVRRPADQPAGVPPGGYARAGCACEALGLVLDPRPRPRGGGADCLLGLRPESDPRPRRARGRAPRRRNWSR